MTVHGRTQLFFFSLKLSALKKLMMYFDFPIPSVLSRQQTF